MSIDEARHDDHAGGVDHLGAAETDARRDRLDLSILDQDIRLGEIANGPVEGQHDAVFEKEPIRSTLGAGSGGCRPGYRRRQERAGQPNAAQAQELAT
jgi:hypothetical protein